jgi:hypothetical protein
LSKKQSTKSVKPELIEPEGASLSVRLFYLEDLMVSVPELVKFMKSNSFTMLPEEQGQGFASVDESGKTISAEFIASFRQSVFTFEKGALKELEPIYSVKKGTVIFKLSRNFVEIRGSDRLASRLRTFLRREEIARIAPVTITKQAKDVFDGLKSLPGANITYTLFANFDSPSILFTQAEFKGNKIQNASEINLYQTRYKGNIAKFNGILPYPSSKKLMKTSVNFSSGSLSIYPMDMTEETIISTKTEIKERPRKDEPKVISPKDLRWLVTMLEDNADPYPPPETQ